jgi:hypothetical protein
MKKKTDYENKLEYNNEYNRRNYQSFSVRFNLDSEKDVIKYLQSQESIKTYLETLIRTDMKKKKKKKASSKSAKTVKKAKTAVRKRK